MESSARKLITLEEWSDLYSEERAELIEGEIIYKSAPSSEHSDAQGAIVSIITNEFHWKRRGPDGWWIRPEISVVYEGRPNGFIHDIAGWKKENFPEKPKGKRVKERPDWVCEILSGNRKDDLDTKKWVLHEHRVPFYWIVDLEAEMISILRWEKDGYLIMADAGKGEKRILPPFDIALNVSILLGEDPE